MSNSFDNFTFSFIFVVGIVFNLGGYVSRVSRMASPSSPTASTTLAYSFSSTEAVLMTFASFSLSNLG